MSYILNAGDQEFFHFVAVVWIMQRWFSIGDTSLASRNETKMLGGNES